MTSFWCRFGIHDWSKWEDRHSGILKLQERKVGSFITQIRTCYKCGKAHMITHENMWTD